METSDDAAVYRLDAETAIISTLDFFTPIVDDPYQFGQIAAANALSDVYAMGGKPLLALNIVCFPSCLTKETMGKILKGGAEKVKEAGAVVVGGHSVDDEEPKYGLSVTGIVHPDKVLKNYPCKPNDKLILTKPLGVGIINTAIKGDIASPAAYHKAVQVMASLNKEAGEIITKYEVNACTDITGFGLMGHAYEMASASKVSFHLNKNNIPYIEESCEYAEMGLVPAGAYRNKQHLEGKYQFSNVPTWMKDILFDPQTSGGLLVSCPPNSAERIISEFKELNLEAALIGDVVPQEDKLIIVE